MERGVMGVMERVLEIGDDEAVVDGEGWLQ
jgi:hypothetical protein